MRATLLMDYATFNFDQSIYLTDVNRIFGDEIDLHWKLIGFNENSPSISPFGLSWLSNSGFISRPRRLQVSGVGCSHFERLLPYLRQLGDNHLSRVDFAFDVVVEKSVWRDFCINSIKDTFDQERCLKRFNFTGSGEALTFYIGSRKCAKFCRIYNKSLQDPEYDSLEDCSDDQYIIRYEIELKHFKSKVQNFDPGVYFDFYFQQSDELISFVKDVWRTYAKDVLLLFELDDLQLIMRNKNFVQSESLAENQFTCADQLYDEPRTFDGTLRYLADRFGKYIPFIIADPSLRRLVLDKCYNYSGFRIDIVLSSAESGFYDLEEDGGAYSPFEPDIADQYMLDQCFI